MRCPRCDRNSLSPEPTGDRDARIDRCRQCFGLWFGSGSLTCVLAVAAKQLEVLDDAPDADLTCPDCDRPMVRFTYPQTLVTVDMCRRCEGIWLDKGELREIRAVRRHLEKSGELEIYAPVTGFKGALLRFIDASIDSLTDQLRD